MNIFNFSSVATGGDWLYFPKFAITELSYIPYLWSNTNGNGLGQNISFILGFKWLFAILTKFFVQICDLPWSVAEKFIFFLPFWILSFSGAYIFSRHFYRKRMSRLLASIIYSSNTYALMLVGGGQMGVALAYAITPFVLNSFFTLKLTKDSVLAGLLWGFQFMTDFRIALITLLAGCIYIIWINRHHLLPLLFAVISGVLINTFWILPLILLREVSMSEAYTTNGMVNFLSFADFSHTISLLHPNWPQNIFGKVYFMQPEFMIIPILAFASLILHKQKIPQQNSEQIFTREHSSYFALIALTGAFLAKGTQDPFGGIYLWFSQNIPGFIIFRDPTKWYVLIAFSYSILIPYTLGQLVKRTWGLNYELRIIVKTLNTKYVILYTFVIVFWLFTIRQLPLGQLTGTFKGKNMPADYQRLEKKIDQDHMFYRTLWLPHLERFGYFSQLHPSIDAQTLAGTNDLTKLATWFIRPDTQELLTRLSVRYYILPVDNWREIFLMDRKYSNALRNSFIRNISGVSGLSPDTSFRQLLVLENSRYYPLMYYENQEIENPVFQQRSVVSYNVQSPHAGKLLFNQAYSQNWQASYGTVTLKSEQTIYGINSFVLTEDINGELRIEYKGQLWVYIGMGISIITLFYCGYNLIKNHER